ncbi:Lrp/AsnC family transcriptional regulator [Colwelliaceae bacterium 6441]
MDDFDSAILNVLQTNSRISTEQIGDIVGLSPSACQRRIKKLKTDGIIKKEVAVIDRDKLESYTTAIIDVNLEKGGEKALDNFIDKLNHEKKVQQFYYTAGDVDFVLIVVVKNMAELDSLTRRLLMSDSNVKKFHSKIAIQSNKLGLEVPI